MKPTVILLVIIASLACMGICGTIELLNRAADNAIEKKAQYEPNSKWRVAWNPRESAKRYAEWEIREEAALSPDDELSAEQKEEVSLRTNENEKRIRSRDRLGRVLGTWGVGLHLLSAALIIVSLPMIAAGDRVAPRWCSATAGMIGLASLSWAIYRGYLGSLGW